MVDDSSENNNGSDIKLECNKEGAEINASTEAKHSNTSLELEEKYKELQCKFTYLYADFENHKRRMAIEKNRFLFDSLKRFILDILPVLDDLERASNFADSTTKEWLMPVISKFRLALSNNGVKKIEAKKGDVYDEKFHDAVATSSASNNEGSNAAPIIKDITLNGYFLDKEVIRHVEVVV